MFSFRELIVMKNIILVQNRKDIVAKIQINISATARDHSVIRTVEMQVKK